MTEKLIASVGGSIFWAWSGSVTLGSTIELETVALVRPAIATMSPALASSTGDPLEAAKGHDLGGAALLDDIALVVQRLDRHVDGELAAGDAPGQHAADEIVAVEQGDEHLERTVRIAVGRRDVADDGLEHRLERARADVVAEAGIAVAARSRRGSGNRVARRWRRG